MKRKRLEGINQLLFTLGAALGYLLAVQNYAWWIVLAAVIVPSFLLAWLVEYLEEGKARMED